MDARNLLELLDEVAILPRRLVLCTPGATPTIPMLRGIWGKALHDLDRLAYHRVFCEGEAGGTPLYVLRAHAEGEFGPVVDHVFLGDASRHDRTLLASWMRACEMGLGPGRVPFFLRGYPLAPDGERDESGEGWPLGHAHWPLAGDPESEPCLLSFPWPLRLLRRKLLVTEPTLPDIIVGICRRVESLLPPGTHDRWRLLAGQCLEIARQTPATAWEGDKAVLSRWSGRQQAEVDLRGVVGGIILPAGPGPLWPLLAAGQWLHVGKGTVMGLGRLMIAMA